MQVRAFRAYLVVESEDEFPYFTGPLVKTLLYSLSKEVRLLHGLRGVVSPLHISPLFTPGRGEFELGRLHTAIYRDGESLVPVRLQGEEYIIHVGGEAGVVGHLMDRLGKLRTPLSIKFKDNIVTFKLEKLSDMTDSAMEKQIERDRVTLYFKGPSKLYNIFTATRLPKFNISPVEVLMTPYMFASERLTLDYQLVLSAFSVLGPLVEAYYSINTIKPILVPYRGKAPGLIGKATYIVDTEDKRVISKIASVLRTAEITGIGRGRQDGFGTVTWVSK